MTAAPYLLLTGTPTSTTPQTGWLHRDGKYLVDEHGAVWRGNGLTCFLLYARYIRGDDITPELQYARSIGVNYLRVFGPIPVPPWGQEWTFYSQPDPRLFQSLSGFFTLLATHGLRCEFVPVCGPWSMASAQAILYAAYEQSYAHWNVLMEWTNEPGQSGTFHANLHQLGDHIPREQTLSATGVSWYLDEASAQQLLGIPKMTSFAQAHFLDYGTPHLNDVSFAGTPNARYGRQSKGLKEWRDGDPELGWSGSGCAEWNDEGARVDDTDSYPDVETHIANTAIACLFGGASLIHYGIGREGRRPNPGGFEDHVIREAAQVWAFIPAKAQTGNYTRGDFADFPIYWTPEDSQIRHAYGCWTGNEGWFVNPLPSPGWTPVPKPGIKIAEVGPRPWIFKATR